MKQKNFTDMQSQRRHMVGERGRIIMNYWTQ